MSYGTNLEILALLGCIALLTASTTHGSSPNIAEGHYIPTSVHYSCHLDDVMLNCDMAKLQKLYIPYIGARLNYLMLYSIMR